ncbi:MAG: ethanolamine ammonia-lyase subunit EutC [Myxococcales bacterium]|nr:ethanolamine ammonia-lyase subunit EutC [Myxococcales bacterium]
MADTLDRGAIEAMVRDALRKHSDQRAVAEHVAQATFTHGGEVLLQPSVLPNPAQPASLKSLIASTPARVAVGRTGTRYTTSTLLKFRADHAAAKEAVLSEVNSELLTRLGFVQVRSQAKDKKHFLQRPDAGRALSDEAKEVVVAKLPKGAQLQIIYGDGLSAEAINVNAEPLQQALSRELQSRGIRANPPLFVHLSRVKIMDEVARLIECESCLFICGERPGLGFADSLSAYFIYRPATGATDADREVISNINPRGFPPAQAAVQISDSIARILRDKKSGVILG